MGGGEPRASDTRHGCSWGVWAEHGPGTGEPPGRHVGSPGYVGGLQAADRVGQVLMVAAVPPGRLHAGDVVVEGKWNLSLCHGRPGGCLQLGWPASRRLGLV